jgi:hypothetical protein
MWQVADLPIVVLDFGAREVKAIWAEAWDSRIIFLGVLAKEIKTWQVLMVGQVDMEMSNWDMEVIRVMKEAMEEGLDF